MSHHEPRPDLRPMKPSDARALARSIIDAGDVAFSGHALDEMRKDDLETTDCLNVIRGGVFEAPELVHDQWRYRASTQRICVVLSFSSPTRLRVVTAWRKES